MATPSRDSLAPAPIVSVDALDAARRRRNTRVLADVSVGIVTFFAVLAAFQPTPAVEWVVIAASFAVYATCAVLARRGKERIAAAALVTVPFLSSTSTVLQEGRLAPSAYFLAAALVFAAATMTVRGVLVAVGASVASLAVMMARTAGVLVEESVRVRIVGTAAGLVLATGLVAVLLAASMRAAIAESYEREVRARAAETRHKLFADHTDDLIALVAENRECVYASPSHERVLGVPVAEMVGHGQPRFFHPEDRADATRALEEAMESGRSRVVVRVFASPSGAVLHVDYAMNAVEVDGQRYVAIAGRDVTKQRSLAEQLQHAQKMDALGRLAGGVAHDFNNLLAVIQSCTALAMRSVKDDADATELLGDVLHASENAAALTRQLLALARRQVIASANAPLSPLLRDATALARRLVRPNIELEVSVPDDLWPVAGQSSQIEQVILNLASNGSDAMASGGTLRIAARNAPAVPGAASRVDAVDHVAITVSDTGDGMSDEVLAHLFEPFFTTKPPGRGTGLGLATCYGIVEQLRGTIAATSAPGAGTTITVTLPRAGSDRPEAEPQRAPTERRPSSPAVVLVVDDDDGVRSLLTRVMEEAGHVVHAARDSAEAVAWAEKEPVDVLVSDVLLEQEHGFDVVRAVRAHRAAVAVVLVSGFVGETDEVSRLVASGYEFVQKPFAPEKLTAAVARALAQRGVASATDGAG